MWSLPGFTHSPDRQLMSLAHRSWAILTGEASVGRRPGAPTIGLQRMSRRSSRPSCAQVAAHFRCSCGCRIPVVPRRGAGNREQFSVDNTGVTVPGARAAVARHRRAGGRVRAAFAFLGLLVALAIAASVPAVAEATLVSARAGELGAFSGGIQQVNGTLTAAGPAYGADGATFAATYSGMGTAGQASSTFNVQWRQGQSVAYGAVFYLPPNSHTAPTGQQALLTWDSLPDTSGRSEQAGVVIDYSVQRGIPGREHRQQRVRRPAGAGRTVPAPDRDVVRAPGPPAARRRIGGVQRRVPQRSAGRRLARHGAGWFRRLGTELDPGSALVTLSGALAAPGVYEIEHGMPLSELLEVAQVTDRVAGVLVGGYFGTWLTADVAREARLSAGHLREYGAALGAGVIVVLGADACPVAETARVAAWFAAESAGQCGPCVNGLDAIAATIHQLATGTASHNTWSDLERWSHDMRHRGACQHPDGAIRFITSALRAFEPEVRDHARRGPCDRCSGLPVLPAPVRAALRS